MLRRVSEFLDSITMYRLVLWGLVAEFIYSILVSFPGLLPYTSVQLMTSAGILILTTVLTNTTISKALKVQTNPESSIISALILYFVLSPLSISTLVLTGFIATISKYVFVFGKKHIFNPAAVALFIAGNGFMDWWVGLIPMMPVVVIVGLMVVAKLRRFHMFAGFFLTALLLNLLSFKLLGVNPLVMMVQMFTTWPAIFFGTIMLSEPLTTPPTKMAQTVYGVFVGMLYGTSINTGGWFWPPEFKLLLANFLSFLIGFKFRIFPELLKRKQLAPGIYEFSFTKDPKLLFKPGQFMEWTFAHDNQDNRGVRRYFTIASSPTEKVLKICIRLSPDKSSSFKDALLNLHRGQSLSATQPQGDFTLPKDTTKKPVFIAGGIGITPFRSMIRYMQDLGEKRSVVLFYSNRNEADIVYRDVFDKKSSLDLKTIYVLTDTENIRRDWKGKRGHVDENMIKTEVPDYRERIYYISGPSSMVDTYKTLLKEMGIKETGIITDYFPGY